MSDDDPDQCDHRMSVEFSNGPKGSESWRVRCTLCGWEEAHGEGGEIPEGVSGAGVRTYGGFSSNDAEG